MKICFGSSSQNVPLTFTWSSNKKMSRLLISWRGWVVTNLPLVRLLTLFVIMSRSQGYVA